MPKLSIADLEEIRNKVRKTTILREGSSVAKITVHMGTCGIAAGARTIMNTVIKIIEESKRDDIIVTTSGCAGFCSKEPMATVELKGESPVKYSSLNESKIKKIFEEHVLKGKIVEEYALAIGNEREP
ncbi:MAG: (2Fe-2S) ferredoxin domain-containing protein [Candidatus Delongbacteria bacterium]|nr:(2Fe-2S) ferredoxin domain-containing protein [Candidatus Delongbacteria bacterium]MCG2760369.1 (2Fe-2S) ferredoxin domain-containing protein [Candidatus Delongbacteria bacterium]